VPINKIVSTSIKNTSLIQTLSTTATLAPKKEQATIGFINSFLDLVTRRTFERIDGNLQKEVCLTSFFVLV
jgi:hypothetical protein